MAAPVFTHITKNSVTTNQAFYDTDPITVVAEKPQFFSVHNAVGSGTATLPALINLPSGVSVSQITTVTFNTNNRLTLFQLAGSGSGTVRIDFSAVVQTGCQWFVDQADDADESPPAAADIVTATGTSTSAGADLTSITNGNSVYMVTAVGAQVAYNASANFTQTSTRVVHSTPNMSLGATGRSNHDDATPDQPLASSQTWAVIAVEVPAEPVSLAPSGGGWGIVGL